MEQELIHQLSDRVQKNLFARDLLDHAFTLVAQQQLIPENRVEKILFYMDDSLSRALDTVPIQEGCSARNVRMARQLAELLIDDEGELDKEQLDRIVSLLKANLYVLGPNRHHDVRRRKHVLDRLIDIQQDSGVRRALRRIGAPHELPIAEELIRETLALDSELQIDDVHARRAALSALLTYLRQNVGSCFATAPAIIVQTEQPKLFFNDIRELFGTGRIKRVVAGQELAVPISPSSGVGDLRKPVLIGPDLAMWQYPVWKAPGVINALEVSGCIESPREAKSAIGKWLASSGVESAVYVDIARILEGVILLKHKLSTEQLEQVENRPMGMVSGGVVIEKEAGSSLDRKIDEYRLDVARATQAVKLLTDNPLLKVWEFSVASFAETKVQFARWNLYASLGFDHNEPNGIGSRLYEMINDKLQEINDKVAEYTDQLEQVQVALQYAESRLKRASSEQEAAFLKSDYSTRAGEFRHVETMRNKAQQKGQLFANLYNGLIEQLDDGFQSYFQEVYDADMREVESGPYDDSPAGFRLLCKYGRANTSQWTMIHNPREFSEALANFFVYIESSLLHSEEYELIRDELSPVITSLVAHVKTTDFLVSAFDRMARSHGVQPIEDPLNHLEKVQKKPWVYTSGGSMDSLVGNYFGKETKPRSKERWVENPTELLAFIIDTIREMPPKVQKLLSNHSGRRLLMHSPTHAFTLLPGSELLKKGWESSQYTYSWIRDYYVGPIRQKLKALSLHREGIQLLLAELRSCLPPGFQEAFDEIFSSIPGQLTPQEFREFVLQRLSDAPNFRMSLGEREIERVLHASLPIISGPQLKHEIEKVFSVVYSDSPEMIPEVMSLYDQMRDEMFKGDAMTSSSFRQLCKTLKLLQEKQVLFPTDYDKSIDDAAIHVGLALPRPFLFADTNWVTDDFAFIVNPGNLELDFWRVDASGYQGEPMTYWRHWVDGSRKSPTWGIYLNPLDYVYAAPLSQRPQPHRPQQGFSWQDRFV